MTRPPSRRCVYEFSTYSACTVSFNGRYTRQLHHMVDLVLQPQAPSSHSSCPLRSAAFGSGSAFHFADRAHFRSECFDWTARATRRRLLAREADRARVDLALVLIHARRLMTLGRSRKGWTLGAFFLDDRTLSERSRQNDYHEQYNNPKPFVRLGYLMLTVYCKTLLVSDFFFCPTVSFVQSECEKKL